MTPEIWAWINKAESDWRILVREAAVPDAPSLDAVCFHAQQSAEKYLKARLLKACMKFLKSHDLLYLHKLALTVEPGWKFLYHSLSELSTYAVASRYPGLDPTFEQAQRAIENCRIVRTTIRLAFDLSIDD